MTRWIAGILFAGALAGCGRAGGSTVTVFGAASLTDALGSALSRYEAEGHGRIRASFAASSVLAKQIEEGAPADLFVSANEAWMDDLERKGRVVAGTRVDLLGNDLVLVTPRDSGLHPDLDPGGDLAGCFTGRLAIADPESVPAGIYGRQALEYLGAYGALKGRLAIAADVRGALTFVARGDCPAGIVYATDAAVEPKVRIAGRFPDKSHDPIRYPAAVIVGGKVEAASALLAWLASTQGMAIFRKAGFKRTTERSR